LVRRQFVENTICRARAYNKLLQMGALDENDKEGRESDNKCENRTFESQ